MDHENGLPVLRMSQEELAENRAEIARLQAHSSSLLEQVEFLRSLVGDSYHRNVSPPSLPCDSESTNSPPFPPLCLLSLSLTLYLFLSSLYLIISHTHFPAPSPLLPASSLLLLLLLSAPPSPRVDVCEPVCGRPGTIPMRPRNCAVPAADVPVYRQRHTPTPVPGLGPLRPHAVVCHVRCGHVAADGWQ